LGSGKYGKVFLAKYLFVLKKIKNNRVYLRCEDDRKIAVERGVNCRAIHSITKNTNVS